MALFRNDYEKLEDELTIIILTNRPHMVPAQVKFWSTQNFKVLILSETALPKIQCNNISVHSLKGFQERLELSADLIGTRFTLWLGDDDFIKISDLKVSMREVINDNVGNLAVYSPPRPFDRNFLHPAKKSQSLAGFRNLNTLQEDSFSRLETLLKNPAADRHWFAIQPSSNYKVVVKAIKAAGLEDSLSQHLAAFLFEFGLTYLQRSKCASSIWYLKGNFASKKIPNTVPSEWGLSDLSLTRNDQKSQIEQSLGKFVTQLDNDLHNQQKLLEYLFQGIEVLKLRDLNHKNSQLIKRKTTTKDRVIDFKRKESTSSQLGYSIRLTIYWILKVFWNCFEMVRRRYIPWIIVVWPKSMRQISVLVRAQKETTLKTLT